MKYILTIKADLQISGLMKLHEALFQATAKAHALISVESVTFKASCMVMEGAVNPELMARFHETLGVFITDKSLSEVKVEYRIK